MPGGDSRLALGYGLFRTAVNWGLRSPNSDANNAYNINTDGSVNNNNVYNANFAPRPALMEYRVQVPLSGGKQGPIIKGGHILSSRPRKLRIVRLAINGKAYSLRCSSSPKQTRCAGLCFGMGTGVRTDIADAKRGDKHSSGDAGMLATGERPRTPQAGEIMAAISTAGPAPRVPPQQGRMCDA